jgi:gliding motility-associated-like protein
MKNTENIEQIFKETFEHFEADVNPNAWSNVQSGINSSAGSAASAAAKLVIGKIVAGVAAIALVAGSIWYLSSGLNNSSSPSNNSGQSQTISKYPASTSNSESQSLNSLSNSQAEKQTASVPRSENLNVEKDASNPVTAETSSANEVSSESSSSDNSASSQPVHKYGNAPKGDGGLIRGNKYPNNPAGSNIVSNSEQQDEETSLPSANIFVSTTSGDAPLTVEFINQGAASSLNWDFGDGSGSKEAAPVHTFEKAGTYVVILNAKLSSGAASDKVTIEVRSSSAIYDIPNIFTPNEDGENDLFYFKMKNIASVGVVIFSQKDGIVCEWNSLDDNWDGKLKNGADAPEGIYFYTIQANGADGVSHSEKGTVTLKRH